MTSGSERMTAGRRPVGVRQPVVWLLALVIVGAVAWWLGAGSRPDVQEFVGFTMGTSFGVTVEAEMSRAEHDSVRSLIEHRLDRVNRLMSTFDSTSELSRLNRHASTEPFPVSEELLEVLAMAHEVSERSAGAFDVTVAPLVDAWGFGPGDRAYPTPDATQLSSLRERVGYRLIDLDHRERTVSKTNPQTVMDLSAIAKGYGVEAVASSLLERGYTSFLVDIGGELKAIGRRSEGRAWRVGIELPDETAVGLHGTVDLIDEAVATSGDYRNFYEDDGVRYAHIIDPRSGSPIRLRGASVSVVHRHAAVADAWATALTVLGPSDGYNLALREGIAALFIMRSNGDFQSLITPAMEDRFVAVSDVDR